MRTSVYSIYDVKSKIYATPMFVANHDIAIRNCVAAMVPGSLLTLFPMDFHLYKIGEYDDETGMLFQEQPEYIGCMADFKVGEDDGI